MGGGSSFIESPAAPVIEEEVFAGSSPHNCGGGCVLKAYVKNGVIKRFTTDETPEKTYLDAVKGDYMQDRACPRCRSQKSWIYSSNRLMYPMIQTKDRGDLTGFRRVTWEQAAKYFKAKAEYVRDNYGPGAFHNLYSSGMGGGYNSSGDMMALVGASGKNMLTTHDDYSFPQWELITRCMHDANSQPRSNDFQDVYNSDELVVWGYNLSEMLNQQQINFTVTQIHEIFKKEGKKITVIDPKYTNTAVLAADEFVPVIQGTDPAMIFAMMHCMLTDYRQELVDMYNAHGKKVGGTPISGINDIAGIRRAIGQYVYGFFDTDATDDAFGTNDSYMLDGADQTTFKTNAKVEPGASLSAYIFGNSNTLVTQGFNQASSIYPDKIGYNVRNFTINGAHDPLYDAATGKSKYIDCYGQVEKTPAWAEKICGVPAATIKDLTRRFLTKNVSCWMMGGLQRNSEGDQACWAWPVLMNVLLCFGKEGRSHGRADGRGNDRRKSISLGWNSGIKTAENIANLPAPAKVAPYLNATKTAWKDPLGDMSLLTFPGNYNSNHSSTDVSVFEWLDACEATNAPKINQVRNTFVNNVLTEVTESVNPSRWNDGQIKRIPAPTKFIFHCGGNININQNGDCNLAVDILTSKDAALVNTASIAGIDGVQMNPKGYKVEFIGMIEVVMTSSCRWADLVLPGSISFERYQTHAGGRSPLTSVTTKAVNPPGNAMVEMEIGAVFAKEFGQDTDYYNGKTPAANESFEKKVWEAALNNPVNTAKFGMNAKEWQATGFYKADSDLTKLPNYVPYAAFLANPGSTVRGTSSNKAHNAVKTCFRTLSGRVEAYCLPMIENYEMRMGNSIDENMNLVTPTYPLGGGVTPKIYSKIANARVMTGKGRFVYPIPMYIPLIEGIHADISHPDPLGLGAEGFKYNLLTWHTIYRSHSTFNSSPLLNEVKYYKRNAKGEAAYINKNVTNAGAGLDNNALLDSENKAPQVWTDDVYETIWLNPATAKESSVAENDVIIVESKRGKIVGSAHLSERVRPGTISMTQGSWYEPIMNWKSPSGKTYDNVDVGGNANTLFGLRPCRIAGGMTLASECRVKIYKA